MQGGVLHECWDWGEGGDGWENKSKEADPGTGLVTISVGGLMSTLV
jgi:hypothetical protein